MEVDRGTHMDLEVVIFDNRGHGKSSVPKQKDEYSTEIMARDVLAVLVSTQAIMSLAPFYRALIYHRKLCCWFQIHDQDHLQWSSAHLIGHSMGGVLI